MIDIQHRYLGLYSLQVPRLPGPAIEATALALGVRSAYLAALLYDVVIRHFNRESPDQHEFASRAVTVLFGSPVLSGSLPAVYIK